MKSSFGDCNTQAARVTRTPKVSRGNSIPLKKFHPPEENSERDWLSFYIGSALKNFRNTGRNQSSFLWNKKIPQAVNNAKAEPDELHQKVIYLFSGEIYLILPVPCNLGQQICLVYFLFAEAAKKYNWNKYQKPKTFPTILKENLKQEYHTIAIYLTWSIFLLGKKKKKKDQFNP